MDPGFSDLGVELVVVEDLLGVVLSSVDGVRRVVEGPPLESGLPVFVQVGVELEVGATAQSLEPEVVQEARGLQAGEGGVDLKNHEFS